jgi:hypothetical protein
MNLGKYIFGVREEYFAKISTDEKSRQFLVYNNLTLMFFTLVVFSIGSGVIFGLMIFNHWLIAIGIGVFLGAISFILLLLMFFLNMTTNYQDLYLTMTEMEPTFEEYEKLEIENWTDEKALIETEKRKSLLREANQIPNFDHFHFSSVITSIIKVSLILIISCVVANAMEFLFFYGSINESLEKIKSDSTINVCAQHKLTELNSELNEKIVLAQWTLEMLKEDAEHPFIFIKSRSVLLTMQVLEMSLGKWKILLDILFALLFLTPFVLLKKSREYAGGLFLKEVALVDISHSLMFFLLSERERRKILKQIRDHYDYERLVIKEEE